MTDGYSSLIKKLDIFIRKYYKNQMLKGVIISISLYLAAYLVVSVSEYYNYFSIPVRTGLFYSLIAAYLFIFVKYILIPLLHFFSIGNVISHNQAAKIIAVHFNQVRDKLQNTLELAGNKDFGMGSRELVLASIEQRINQLHPVPFTNAINMKDNLRYLKFFLPILFIFLLILVFSPTIFTDSTTRLMNHSTYFAPMAPFSFTLTNDSLTAKKGSDFSITLTIEGKYVPDHVAVNFGNSEFVMKKESNTEFSYLLKNVNNNLDFSFNAEEYSSETYSLKILPNPVILDFNIQVDVPEYTGEKDRIINSIGDLTVPQGSLLKWNFNTRDIEKLTLVFNDSIKETAEVGVSLFSFSKTMNISADYKISVENQYFTNPEILKYTINVVPDMHPGIKLDFVNDSMQPSVFYFKGIISDDYGFRNMYFCCNNSGAKDSLKKIPIPISANATSQEYYYSFDFSAIPQGAEGKTNFYFEVWDNDQVNGSKFTRSANYEYKLPTKEELRKMENEVNENIQKQIEKSMELATELKEDIKKLRQDLVNENMSNWEKSKIMEQIAQKQNTLEQMIDLLKQENAQKNEKMNSFTEQQKELMEKQEQIQDLLENLMNDDLKKLIDEFNKQMSEMDDKKLNELNKDMELSYDEMSEQLDRNLELLKKYELEQKIESTANEMKELAEKQEELSKMTEQKMSESKKEELTREQEKQSGKFDELKKEYEEIKKNNEELENKMNLDDFKEEMENIKNEFMEGSKSMQENKGKKASKSQKQNSKNLESLAASMKQMMENAQAAQNEEDMDQLRQILDNLVTYSFDQEDLMERIKNIDRTDPRHQEYQNNQRKLNDDFSVIKDSLQALGKRTPQLSSVIDKEIYSIERSSTEAMTLLEDHQTPAARAQQQYVMTSTNNLALLLSEVLQSMQQQAAAQMPGQQECQGDGKKKPGLSRMKGQQESLKSQLESMIQQMKDSKDGKNGKLSEKALNKKLAQMLAQQEMFQKEMSDMMKNGEFSPETMKKLNEINKMIEQTEKELVNKSITPNTLKRQNQILTKLLEAENSEYQREIEEKRESTQGKNDKLSNPKEIFEYKGINSSYNELLRTNNLKLTKYYQDKYEEYLIKLNQN